MSWGRADLQGRGYWLLDLQIEGRTYRYSTETVEVTADNGDTLTYSEGLEDLTIARAALAEMEPSVGIRIQDSTDWSALAAKGVTLERQSATLRRWWPGMTLADARTYLRGFIEKVVYETSEDPLEASLVRRIQGTSWPMLGDDEVVDEITFPDVAGTGTYERDPDLDGSYYPLVIGRPGDLATGNSQPASPAILVKFSTNAGDTANRFLIATGKIEAADQASGVRIWDVTDGRRSELCDTESTTDGIGRTVTLAKAPTDRQISGTNIAHGRQYWAGFEGTYGGVLSPFTGSLLRGAAEVMEWLLTEFSSEPVDTGRLRAVADQLNTVKIDCFLNAGDVRPLEWIEAHLEPILPIRRVWGDEGIYWRVVRWWATAQDAIAHLDADPDGNVEQVGPVKPADVEIYNNFSLAYQLERDRGRYRARTFIQPTTDANDSRKLPSLLCARSEQVFGELRAPRIESAVLWDQASANQCLTWKVAAHAWPKRVVPVRLPPEWEYLEEGDVVTYTRTSGGFTNAPALVSSIQVGDPSWVLAELTLLDHPVHTVHIP